ncbi:hypothetical protein N781_15015 [Pontibacillus halophilus JSM 076056 = DSM 19796]|uniref:Uncharacterized protein n=1 Tax=Pontibacillus halophilus JSM 076056 = DSM 19796 TaxID=1385510 RepID=A0A0A5GN25_9BACI|nr:hypothetical protein [Pontibacillus halophilus]KGX92633.1 hypothetical protein N781_15015 [Pontibacillus halophilus JSM 076056 = DSM 19796]
MQYLNEEERELATRYLFLSMALVVIRQDIQTIEQGSFKLKEPYVELLRKMDQKGKAERRYVKEAMNKKQLHVILLNKSDSFTSYLFTVRGYEEKRNYFNPAIKKNVENIFYELMRKVMQRYDGYTKSG